MHTEVLEVLEVLNVALGSQVLVNRLHTMAMEGQPSG